MPDREEAENKIRMIFKGTDYFDHNLKLSIMTYIIHMRIKISYITYNIIIIPSKYTFITGLHLCLFPKETLPNNFGMLVKNRLVLKEYRT